MPFIPRKSAPMHIVVGGLVITYPFGGMFWHYIQFVLGLRQLGHNVLYVEDLGRWCYNPRQATFVESGADNAALFARNLNRLDPDLAGCWMFRDVTGAVYGRSHEDAEAFCQGADIFLNISLSHNVEGDYAGAACTILVDTDPMYTQALLEPDAGPGEDEEAVLERERVVRMLEHHDAFFTFGLNVGGNDCRVPTGNFTWHPLVQPVALDCFEGQRRPQAARRRVYTTVASWEPHEALTRVGGVLYSGKSREFDRILDLPRRGPDPLELALSGIPPLDMLREHGWNVVDGSAVSSDPWRYQTYLADSLGELSVAKHAYVASRSGWFSDRSASYLALGVPVILQDTGFSRVLPTGEGLLPFRDADEAVAALEAVAGNPEKHASAARDIAQAHFRADRVMNELLEVASTYA